LGFGFARFFPALLSETTVSGRLRGELRFMGTGRQGEPQFAQPADTAQPDCISPAFWHRQFHPLGGVR
jgi:hypothetical protein